MIETFYGIFGISPNNGRMFLAYSDETRQALLFDEKEKAEAANAQMGTDDNLSSKTQFVVVRVSAVLGFDE